MTIVSPSFYALTAVFVLLYYVLPNRLQWAVLLAASVSFFMLAGTPYTIVYLGLSALVTWYAACKIGEAHEGENGGKQAAKKWLILALIVNLGLLAALKYTNFVLSNAAAVYGAVNGEAVQWRVNWPAALGISYYTLQLVAYLADCYWGICKPQKHFGRLALFASFFPQMISGPISKYEELGKQLEEAHRFDKEELREGLLRIVVGVFKKVALADNLAVVVPFFLHADVAGTAPLPFLAMLGYVVLVYADFSGCMDIISGVALLFGIRMTKNFDSPFLSRSIQEFWQRWHITLGRFLKEYVMYPLLRTKLWAGMTKGLKKSFGKAASKKIPTFLAMLILWFFMGLWHGGGWNYILEGVWFWLVIVLGDLLTPLFKKITSRFDTEGFVFVTFQRLRTLLIYAVGAVLFYFPSVTDGLAALKEIFSPVFFRAPEKIAEEIATYTGLSGTVITVGQLAGIAIAFVLFLVNAHLERKNGSLAARITHWPVSMQVLLAAVLLYVLIFIGAYGPGYNAAEFVYGGF
ncbi:MAG: MBOAT family protein [Lachnospiraceae bacterium]|nr:MBOAT family protein [Lachnospiraceae bacterium]